MVGEVIHGDSGTGACEDGMSYLMLGICWKVYRNEDLRRKYLKDEMKEIESEEKFGEWMIRNDQSGEMLNGCRLMLNVWRDYE